MPDGVDDDDDDDDGDDGDGDDKMCMHVICKVCYVMMYVDVYVYIFILVTRHTPDNIWVPYSKDRSRGKPGARPLFGKTQCRQKLGERILGLLESRRREKSLSPHRFSLCRKGAKQL